MQQNGICIHWQPVVKLRCGSIVGHETLARFNDGTPPDQRLFEVHRVGLAVELDSACRKLTFEESPPDGLVFVNLHPATLVAMVDDNLTLTTGQVDPRRVVWELPELPGWPDGPEGVAAIRRALPAGSQIALDDVGEGHADLFRWITLRPAWVKLGHSLIHGMADDFTRRAMVHGLVRTAEYSGCRVVAEGIERDDDARCATDLGVEFGQGFLFGAPQRLPAVLQPAAHMR